MMVSATSTVKRIHIGGKQVQQDVGEYKFGKLQKTSDLWLESYEVECGLQQGLWHHQHARSDLQHFRRNADC